MRATHKGDENNISHTDIQTTVMEISRADPAEQERMLADLPPERRRVAFDYFPPRVQQLALSHMSQDKALAWLEEMEPDDRARLFQELPASESEQYLSQLSPSERQATELLLRYPPETAGRVMSPFFIALHEEMRAKDALLLVEQQGKDAETVYELPVVTAGGTVAGVVTLRTLLLANRAACVKDLMRGELKTFSPQDDQEVVARFLQMTDWLAVPIVEEGRLIGIVTIDDAMDILRLEETEDISLAGATEPLGKPYFSVSVFRLMRKRVIWLYFLAIAGTLTVNVLNKFEATLDQVVSLALFIPLLIGIGGNVGAQSATTLVRALAVNDVCTSDIHKVAIREASVGAMLGLSIATVGYVVVLNIFSRDVALIVSLTVLAICTLAALVGSLMPILARVIKLDPAVVSAPFVTTIVDATGLLIYFMVAKTVMGL